MEELRHIGAHDILLRDVMHCGFLYKRAQDRKVDVLGEVGEQVGRALGFHDRSRRWQLRYVIIYQHYVLYFRDDKAKRPQGVFSLTGYNRVMRDEVVSGDRKWSFKIIGLRSDARTWYFNAASEKEMKLWMAYFKVAMEQAIHGKAREKSLKILQDLKHKHSTRDTMMEDKQQHSGSSSGLAGGPAEQLIYEDIEMPLYDDTASPTTPHALPKRPLPSLPALDDTFMPSPRRSSAGARTGISMPVPVRSPRDSMDSDQFDDDYITPEQGVGDCASPRLGRPLPPTPHPSEPMMSLGKGLQQPPEIRTRNREAKSPSMRMGNRHPSIDGMEEEKPGLRRGPEGNSFRKGITERPHLPLEQIIKMPVTSKPSDAGIKPATKPKPKLKPSTKPPVIKPKPLSPSPPVVLLPDSANITSSDKVYTEGLLRKHYMDGMYLLRLGTEQGQVLMVWDSHNTRCKHYKIFQDQEANLHLDHNPKFDNVLKLLEYYKNNYLPNSQLLLQKPFTG